MRLYPILKVAIPGIAMAAVCLWPAPNLAQIAAAVREDARGGAPLQSQISDASGSALQQPARTITLDPPTGLDLQAHTVDSKGNALPEAPANFRRLGEATVGEVADLHTLTLRFSQTTRITGISVTKDFKIEQGGSCVEGDVYENGSTCRLLVRFTPQGPGNRVGKLTVSHEGSATPDAFGIGGYGYSPIVSFIPSIITTVPGTYPSSVGLLSGAQNLAIDGSDTLWVSDTGNNVVRNMDASGSFKTLASGYTGPLGIAVDTFGEAYFDLNSNANMYEIYDYGPVVQISGSGSQTCTAASPCNLSGEALGAPGELSIDAYNNLFFVDNHSGAAMATVQPTPAKLVLLYDPFPYQTSPSSAMAVDSNDNLYSLWSNGGTCSIIQQSLYNAENSNVAFNKIAGGHTCGFAGDGGLAGNAEIGAKIGQIVFDTAGNLYFTDTNNQRVRRIDNITGIIRTIAGNGIAGYTDDGSLATLAELSYPTGVGVDSQGQVYIISGTGSTSGGAQVIRKVTPTGRAYFGNIIKGSSANATVLVSNTGNSSETLTSGQFTGPAASDYSINTATTSCVLTPGSALFQGQTCQIGFTFTPSALGSRNASYVLLNNTVNGSNTIQMLGAEVVPAANFKITSPTNGASFTSGTAVTFSVSVTSSSGPAPTGTVQFKVDGANFGSPVTISSGAASTSVTGLTQTTHTLSATYSGDANYAAGGPISVGITVTAAIVLPRVTLAPMMQAANASCGQNSYQVSVTSASGVPTGSVQLTNGNTLLASGQLSNGQAMLTTPQLASGLYSLVAHYSGDARNLPADSPALSQQITVQPGCGPGNGAPVQPGSGRNP
jgi:sugar lactone lactonase YvrE